MDIRYFSDTDTLYVGLADGDTTRRDYPAYNVTLEFDVDDNLLAITLEHAGGSPEIN